MFTILLTALGSQQAKAQIDIRNSVEKMPMISFNYGIYLPGGDLAKRFGPNNTIGLQFSYKTRQNWVFGADGNFLFSRNVKENTILAPITSPSGEVFDKDSQISRILLFERGYTFNLNAGKVFPLFGPNPNSGLLVKGGIGFIQHKIRIEHQNNRIPQLEGEYYKGYDRLTNGLLLTQFIGYLNMSNSRLANFYFGIELNEGFTQNRRELNFDTRTKDTANRLDLMYGFKLGWCLNLYKRVSTGYYVN